MIQGTVFYGNLPSLTDEQILKGRACYCPPPEKRAELKHFQEIPEGFCGRCEVCDKPGHACHYPGPLPYTGCWCDEHFLIEVREQPRLKAVREMRKRRAENSGLQS